MILGHNQQNGSFFATFSDPHGLCKSQILHPFETSILQETTVANKPHLAARTQQTAKKIPLRKEEELRGVRVNKGVKVTQQGGGKV
jgi:hypothetical protein